MPLKLLWTVQESAYWGHDYVVTHVTGHHVLGGSALLNSWWSLSWVCPL